MDLQDGRALPLCSVRVYAPGQGDPVVLDHGDGSYYDVVKETYGWGIVELDGNGVPLLEWVHGVGLVCRPYLVGQDTLLSQWTTAGGSWEQVRPATGSPRYYRLSQYNTTANVQWSATSAFNMPVNPDFCFSLIVPAAPPDNNSADYPPYIRVEFGNGAFAIQFAKVGSRAELLAWNLDLSLWVVVQELHELQHVANQEHSEAFVWVRCLRGMLAVSMDMGRRYTLFHWPDPTIPVVVDPGPVTFRGQGNAALMGLHQLLYYEGDYESPVWNTFTDRSTASPVVTAAVGPTTYSPPDGTSISFTDNGMPSCGIAGYIATLTPAANTSAGPPGWQVWGTPELQAVRYEFPITLQPWGAGGAYDTPFDGLVRTVDVIKPLERGDSRCKLKVRLDAAQQFVFHYGRWPKVVVLLGDAQLAGEWLYTVAFTGYLRDPAVDWSESGTLTFEAVADGSAIRFKRTRWARTFRLPLSGMTVNCALNYILYTEGLGPEYAVWDPAGDAVFLYPGQPEKPFEWPAVGEYKWHTMERLAGYAGCEVIPMDDGTFITLPKNFVQPYLGEWWDGLAPENLYQMIERADYGYDSGETVTAGIVSAKDQWGREIIFWVVDAVAEQAPLSGRFCPWREVWQEEVPGTANALIVAARVQALATDKLLMKQEARLHAPVQLGVSRGDAVQVYNTPTGVNNTDILTVMTLHHHYEFDPSFESLYTLAGLRRIL